MPDDNRQNKVKDVKNPFPLTDRMKKRLENPEIMPFSEVSDALRASLERITGIRVDSDQSLREAADIIHNREIDPEMEQKVRDIEARALRILRERAPHCSICGKTQTEVSQLFGDQNNLICDKCIEART